MFSFVFAIEKTSTFQAIQLSKVNWDAHISWACVSCNVSNTRANSHLTIYRYYTLQPYDTIKYNTRRTQSNRISHTMISLTRYTFVQLNNLFTLSLRFGVILSNVIALAWNIIRQRLSRFTCGSSSNSHRTLTLTHIYAKIS